MPAARAVRVRFAGRPAVEVPVHGSGVVSVAPLEIDLGGDDTTLTWTVANTGSSAVDVDAIGVIFDAGPAAPRPLVFSNGYQSWAPATTRVLGRDQDPSHEPRSRELVRAAFHADPTVAARDELRSEQVAVVSLAGDDLLCVGFAGGARHAGTIRARRAGAAVELVAEAWLGGATFRPGATRVLHDVVSTRGDDAGALLERWAARVGAAERARAGAPFRVGWCSWYQYFHDIDERAFLANLDRADDWPFDVFQLDDGYQRTIGDWLTCNDKFPSGIDGIADAVRARGTTAGIWLAPFLAAPDASVVRDHPEWLARAPQGDGPAIGMYHEIWGGVMWELDTTRDDVLEHLESTAARLVDAGFDYLKLDFTFSAAMPGRYADRTRTPAERVRAGYDAIRRGAGDDAFILGCGAPLGAVVGLVDAMRVGADVAPWWIPPPDRLDRQPGYLATTPATRHAFVNTCTRNFMHRRLWVNDPDCVMLRSTDTDLGVDAAHSWARAVAISGGLVLVSDDLALLGPAERQRFDEVVAVARAADTAAIGGATARCTDLLDPAGPTTLTGPAGTVRIDLATGVAAP